MSTKVGVGFSANANSREAANEAFRQAQEQAGGPASLVLAFMTSKHDARAVHQVVRAILRHQPTHVEDIAARLQTEPRERITGWQALRLCAVGDVLGAGAETPLIVTLDCARIGDDHMRELCRQKLGELDVTLGYAWPFLA